MMEWMQKHLGYTAAALFLVPLACVAFFGLKYSQIIPETSEKADTQAEPSLDVSYNNLQDVPEYGTSAEPQPPIVEGREVSLGDWYALELSDGTWKVVKVLKTDNTSVFMAAYYDEFAELPSSFSVSKLERGYGHEAIPVSVFAGSKPHFLKADVLTDDERKAFRIWYIQRGT